MATVVPGQHLLDQAAYRDLVSKFVSLRIGSLLLPLSTRSQELQERYSQWLEDVPATFSAPNSDRIAGTCRSRFIESLDVNQAAYGSLYLKQLPEQARRMLILDDPEFAELCEYRPEVVFSVGPYLQVTARSLFAAATKAFDAETKITVSAISGNKITVNFDEASEGIQLQWVDNDGAKQEAPMPNLSLLSRNEIVRQETFKRIVAQLGPTFDAIDQVKEEIVGSARTMATLSKLLDATPKGVVALQHNMDRSFIVDNQWSRGFRLILSYFERLVGACRSINRREYTE